VVYPPGSAEPAFIVGDDQHVADWRVNAFDMKAFGQFTRSDVPVIV
jgi:hypothetical protein